MLAQRVSIHMVELVHTIMAAGAVRKKIVTIDIGREFFLSLYAEMLRIFLAHVEVHSPLSRSWVVNNAVTSLNHPYFLRVTTRGGVIQNVYFAVVKMTWARSLPDFA